MSTVQYSARESLPRTTAMLAVEIECSMLAGKVAAAEETFTLAEASALELGPFDVTINCLAPGPFVTDLPLKVLVWRAEDGTTWLSYNDPVWLAERHGIMPESADTLRQMSAALISLAEIATRAP